MAIRKRPSIFDIFENFTKGSPFGPDWLEEPFEDMIKRFEESMPAELGDLVKEEETPYGIVRRYGPFVYGFSCTAEPGKEPVFQEFGNIRPSYRRLEPIRGREPLVDVIDDKDKYKIYVELPGVDKNNVRVDVAEDSIEIKTEDDKKFYKMVNLESLVDENSSKASYKNGVLTIELDRRQRERAKELKWNEVSNKEGGHEIR